LPSTGLDAANGQRRPQRAVAESREAGAKANEAIFSWWRRMCVKTGARQLQPISNRPFSAHTGSAATWPAGSVTHAEGDPRVLFGGLQGSGSNQAARPTIRSARRARGDTVE